MFWNASCRCYSACSYFHARYLQSQWRKCDLPVKSQAVGSTLGKVSGSRKAPKSHFTVQAGFGRGFRQGLPTPTPVNNLGNFCFAAITSLSCQAADNLIEIKIIEGNFRWIRKFQVFKCVHLIREGQG